MKKLPCPDVQVIHETANRTVLHFEWETISFQMFDDEARRLARTIYDVLEEAP